MNSNETTIPWDDPFWLDEDESDSPMKSEVIKNENEEQVKSSQLEVIEEQAETSNNISSFIEENLKFIKENTVTVEPVNYGSRNPHAQGRPYHSNYSSDHYNQTNLPNKTNNYNNRNNYNRSNYHGSKVSNQGPRQNYRENNYPDSSVSSHGYNNGNNNKNYRNRNNIQKNYRNRPSNNEERYSRYIATTPSESISKLNNDVNNEIHQNISEKELEIEQLLNVEKEEKETSETPISEQIEEPVCLNPAIDENIPEEKDSEDIIAETVLDVENLEKDDNLIVDNGIIVEAIENQREPLCENTNIESQPNEEFEEIKNDTPKRPPREIYNVNSVKGKWSNLFNGTEGSTLKLPEQKFTGRQLPKQTNGNRKPNYMGDDEQVSNGNRFHANRDSMGETNDQSNTKTHNFHGHNKSSKQGYRLNKNDDICHNVPNNDESIVGDKNSEVSHTLTSDRDKNVNPTTECDGSSDLNSNRDNTDSRRSFKEKNRSYQKDKFNKVHNEYRQRLNEDGHPRNNEVNNEYQQRPNEVRNSKNNEANNELQQRPNEEHHEYRQQPNEVRNSRNNEANNEFRHRPNEEYNEYRQRPNEVRNSRNNEANNEFRQRPNEVRITRNNEVNKEFRQRPNEVRNPRNGANNEFRQRPNEEHNEYRQRPNEVGNSRNNDYRSNRFERDNKSEYEARKLSVDADYDSRVLRNEPVTNVNNDLRTNKKNRDYLLNEERNDEANLSYKNNKNWKDDTRNPKDRDNRANHDSRSLQYDRNNRSNNDSRKHPNEAYNTENNNSKLQPYDKMCTPTNEYTGNNQNRRENAGTNDSRGSPGQRFKKNHNAGKEFQNESEIVPIKTNNIPENRNGNLHDKDVKEDYKRFQEGRNKTDSKFSTERRNDLCDAERNKSYYNNTQSQRYPRTHENDYRKQEQYNPDNNEPRKPMTRKNNTAHYDRESSEIKNEPQRPANAMTKSVSNGDDLGRDNFKSVHDNFRAPNRNNRNYPNKNVCPDNERRNSHTETERTTNNNDCGRPLHNGRPQKTMNYSFMSGSKFVNENHTNNLNPNR